MLTQRFEQLLKRLISAFLHYDDAHRGPERTVQLATARAQLDDLRQTIASERNNVLGLGRSRTREDHWRAEEAIARDGLFTLANTSN